MYGENLKQNHHSIVQWNVQPTGFNVPTDSKTNILPKLLQKYKQHTYKGPEENGDFTSHSLHRSAW